MKVYSYISVQVPCQEKISFLGYGLKRTESIRLQVFQIELYLIKEMMK